MLVETNPADGFVQAPPSAPLLAQGNEAMIQSSMLYSKLQTLQALLFGCDQPAAPEGSNRSELPLDQQLQTINLITAQNHALIDKTLARLHP